MSSIIESAAAFGQRCDELVADGSLRSALSAQGITKFKDLAFAAAHRNHSQLTKLFVTWRTTCMEPVLP